MLHFVSENGIGRPGERDEKRNYFHANKNIEENEDETNIREQEIYK